MPPKQRITKDMILNTALDITRENGFESVNARNIADGLNCSTRPIFSCYKNMVELKEDFLEFAYSFYVSHTKNRRSTVDERLVFPISYIDFAKNESELFKLLFISDITLKMKTPSDFYKEQDNIKNAENFAAAIGIPVESAKKIFLDLFLYSHGIAVLTAESKIYLDDNHIETMIENMLSSLIEHERKILNDK